DIKRQKQMKRIIKKVAVLGSGIMGSRIAAHFANIGFKVLLLDIVPKELNDKEKGKGISENDIAFRNRIVNEAWQNAVKSKPAPLYHDDFASRVTLGNFDVHMKDIADCDWVIE